jgi:phosphoribosylaminoimidazole-succinocarboxamide synthase
MTTTVGETSLPLSLLRRGKVREVYEIDDERLLMVTSDRISAFDVIMNESIPMKGAVLTQLSAYWFNQLAGVAANHFISADTDEIIEENPSLADHRPALTGRSMLVRRTEPVLVECVIRGYITGSAWKEYRNYGTLAGEPLAKGLRESDKLDPPIFSPATKAQSGHDENITFDRVMQDLGAELAGELRDRSMAIYTAARDQMIDRGIIIADTKFEFGHAPDGALLLIDEVLTPDSSRFWPTDQYEPSRGQPSFDKQPLRDYLDKLRKDGKWNGNSPPPTLPDNVIATTSTRYQDAFKRVTGHELSVPAC